MPDQDQPAGDPAERLRQLEARLAEIQQKRDGSKPGAKVSDDLSGNFVGMAFRLGVELAASMAVAMGAGWLLDHWLGTRPWLMVAFFFVGAAAGMLNVYRVSKNIGLAAGYRKPDQEGRDGSDHK